MSTIVVGVDGTDRSDDAIALARELAAAGGAEIVLASAVPYPAIALVGEGVAGVVEPEVVAEAEQQLDRSAAPLRAEGIRVHCVAKPFVTAPHCLQTLAEERQADLVIVGSTHSSRWGRVLPGSTGERLLHGAPCPVAVAPEGYAAKPAAPWHRIGVAFDASAEARAALWAGAGLARLTGARLDVISVLAAAARYGAPALMGGPGYDRLVPDLEAHAQRQLDAAVAELPSELEATGRLLAGDPADRLAEASEACDLMLAGSRRYGPLRAVLLGGVTGRLARRCACPLIITPRSVETPLAAFFDLAATGASGP
jgi:nucleotide-binding universal stress UspA family protein